MAKPKVVVSLLSKDQEFQSLQAEDAARAAQRAGLDVEVLYARNNNALQREQLYRFVGAPEAARPVAIIAQPVSDESLARVACDAVKAGIGWVVLSRESDYIAGLRSQYPKLPIAVVTADQVEIGRIQGRQVCHLLPNGGTILYVQGPSDTSAARQRSQGLEEAIAGSNVHVKSVTAEWTEASGEQAVISWLRLASSDSIAMVVAQNDEMAAGARKAIAARKPEWLQLPFTGCDGLAEGGQRMVNERQLAATVILQSNAGPAIDLIAAHLKTGMPPPARIVLKPRPFPAR